MRLPAVTESQRVARDYIRDRRGSAAELIELADRTLTELKYQLRVQQDKLLSAGDTQQTETVLTQAERLLGHCKEALPLLQTFEDRFAMPGAFERLKAEFVTDGEEPQRVVFGDNYEAMTWLADRVLLFSRYLTETQLPWLRNAIDEINQWMVDRAHAEDDAPQQIAAARARLAELREADPRLRFLHSEGLLRDAEQFLEQLARDRAQNYHKGVAENARLAAEYAEGAVTMAEEAVAFAGDPENTYRGALDAVQSLRETLVQRRLPVPSSLQRAEELLGRAWSGVSTDNPDWPAVLQSYNQASAAFADAMAESGIGES